MSFKITLDIEFLTLDQQRELFLHLKAKFEPGAPIIKAAQNSNTDELSSQKIEQFEFPNKAYIFLKAMGISTIGEICQYKQSDFLRIRGMGKGTVLAIESILGDYGLKLKDE